jgi:O-antigen/teichoic acid export membrane protein
MFKKLLNSAILMTWVKDFVRIGTPFFVVPLVLARYSAEEQTFYFWIGILFAFVLVADAGVSSVVMRATSYFKAGAEKLPKNKVEFDLADEIHGRSPNFMRIEELFHTSKWIYYILSSFLVIMLSTAGVAAFWNLLAKTGHRPDMWAAYGVLVVYFGIYMLNIRWSSFMRGLDFVATEAKFSTITTAVRIALWIIALSFGLKPLVLTLVLLGEGIATHIYLRYFIIKWFRINKVTLSGRGSFNKEMFMSLWPAAWRMGGIQLGNFLVERGNNILILQVNDTALMANFTFTTWILKTLFTFSLTPVYSRLPVLYKYAAEKNFPELKRSAAGYMFLGLTMLAASYILVGGLGNPLLVFLNSDRRIIFPLILFVIMALTEMLDLHSSFHAGVYTSTNHIPFFWPSIISGAIIFFTGLFFTLPVYGLVGIILTRFIVQLCFNNWFAAYLNLRFLKWPVFNFIIDVPKYGFGFIFYKIREFLSLNK